MPGKELDVDQIAEAAFEMIEKLGNALRKLEVEDGPKLETEHIEMVRFADRLVYRKKVEANAACASLQECVDLAGKLQNEVNGLNADLKERMERHSEVVIPLDPDDPDAGVLPVREEHRSLDNLIAALKHEFKIEFLRVSLERAAIWPDSKSGAKKSSRGEGHDAKARLIAAKVAEIYMLLRNGAVPTYGNDHENRPCTPYTRAVAAVFDLLGIKRPTFRRPCRFVVNEIKAKRMPAEAQLKE